MIAHLYVSKSKHSIDYPVHPNFMPLDSMHWHHFSSTSSANLVVESMSLPISTRIKIQNCAFISGRNAQSRSNFRVKGSCWSHQISLAANQIKLVPGERRGLPQDLLRRRFNFFSLSIENGQSLASLRNATMAVLYLYYLHGLAGVQSDWRIK